MDRRRYSTLLVLAVAALAAEACSSSSKSGTGGAGGGASSMGGATGTGGGTGTGGKGTGGTTGTGGATGTGGKVDSGTDSPTDTPLNVDANADLGPAAVEKAMCLTPMFSMNITVTPFTAAQFCTLYFDLCNDRVGATHFANMGDCVSAYNGYNMTPDADMSPSGQQGCRSYHLCNAYNKGNPTTATLDTHCPHTTGFLPMDAGPGGPCP